MKKLLTVMLCFLIALSVFAGCSGETPAVSTVPSQTASPVAAAATATPAPSPTKPPLTLMLASASVLSETHKGDALKKGIEDLKTLSGGTMAVDFFEGGEKGTDADIIEAMKSGSVSIYTGDASMMAQAIPQLAVLELPMMFTDISACNAMLGGSFIDMMQPSFNTAGLQLLGAYSTSFCNLTSNKPIAVTADLAGLRLSTSKSQYDQLFWSTLGCNVMPLERSQVYVALKQGLLEGQESADAQISELKLYEAQTTLIKTRHSQPVGLFVMNKAQYDALTDEQKGWLAQFVSQTEKDEETAVAEDEAAQEKTFGKKKMPVSEPTPEVLAALKGAVQPVIDAMKQTVDPAFVDQYIAACQQAKPAAPAEQPTDPAQASASPSPAESAPSASPAPAESAPSATPTQS